MKTRDHVRTRHDEWVKRALSLWLAILGDVRIDARIAGETRRGDVLYTERRKNPAYRRKLGTLGELARGSVLFEPFRNPPTTREIVGCVLKRVELDAQQARAARRAKRKQSTVQDTVLCVITPSLSPELITQVEATPISATQPGLWRLAPVWHTVIVVANKLPVEDSTLWLRLLGRGAVQAKAVQQVLEMSETDPLRDATLRLLVA